MMYCKEYFPEHGETLTNMLQETYTNKLYPLQDKVLKLLEKVNTHFYLTGGTVLGRYYLHHRYSDDLDLFVNQLTNFKSETENS